MIDMLGAYLELSLASPKKALPKEALKDTGCQVLFLDGDFEL
jgi:hypothetical protein